MKELLKQIKADFVFSSVLCVALGLVFIIWPEMISGLVGTVCAIILMVMGIIYLCSYFIKVSSNGLSAATGALLLLLGIWVLVQPDVVLKLIPILIGVVLLAHGVRGFRESWESKTYGNSSWGVGAVFAIISMVFGIYCIVNAFGMVKLTFLVIGIALIYNGVSDIYIAIVASKSERKYRKTCGTIDVEFLEEEEDK